MDFYALIDICPFEEPYLGKKEPAISEIELIQSYLPPDLEPQDPNARLIDLEGNRQFWLRLSFQ
jgi:hypothetical protein